MSLIFLLLKKVCNLTWWGVKVLWRRSFQSWWNVRFGKLLNILSLEPHKISPKTKHTGQGLGMSIFKSIPPALDLRSGNSMGGDPRNTTACASRALSPGPMGWLTDCGDCGEWGLWHERPAVPAGHCAPQARIEHARQLLLFTDTLIEVCSGTSIYGWLALGIEWIGKRKKWRTEYKNNDSLTRTYLFRTIARE